VKLSQSVGFRNILITGGTGLLGVAIQRTEVNNINGFSIYYPERRLVSNLPFSILAADVTDKEQMRKVFEWAKPDIVIHTAGIGSVDFAEKNRDIARTINIGGTQIIIDLCIEHNARLIYVSSNAVFDGETPLYNELSPVNPINYYGMLKVEAEELVKSSLNDWTIVRPILMFGWHYPGERENPVTWWLDTLRKGLPLKVVDNVYSKPLYAKFCAEVIWKIIDKGLGGIFHIAGFDHVSLYQFSVMTAEVFGLDSSLIEPVPDTYFPEIAPRPRDTSFDTYKIENELGLKPPRLEECLQHMKLSEKSEF